MFSRLPGRGFFLPQRDQSTPAESFVGYQRDGFGEADHTELFELTKKLGNFTMSNANVLIVREAFDGYKTAEVSARRAIHSKDPSVTTTEVIITTL